MRRFKLCFWFLFISLSLLGACSYPDSHDSTGKKISVSDYKGKWVVLNYWASWCKPCMVELPELNQLYKKYNNQVMVLAINFDSLPDVEINNFAQSLQLDFPLLSQFPKEKWGIAEIPTLPVTFLISPEGKLTATLYGPQTQASLAQAMQL